MTLRRGAEIEAAMSDITLPGAAPAAGGVTRGEKQAALAEVLALLATFLVAFIGRPHFGETVKHLLIAISVLIGGVGAAAGLLTLRRGLLSPAGRAGRIALGGFMAFIGVYTIFHVLTGVTP
jgi:hypothetical protein